MEKSIQQKHRNKDIPNTILETKQFNAGDVHVYAAVAEKKKKQKSLKPDVEESDIYALLNNVETAKCSSTTNNNKSALKKRKKGHQYDHEVEFQEEPSKKKKKKHHKDANETNDDMMLLPSQSETSIGQKKLRKKQNMNVDVKSENIIQNLEPSDVAGISSLNTESKKEFLTQVLSILPHNDRRSYKQTEKLINWERIDFHNFTPQQCLTTWQSIIEPLHKLRTVAELINNALSHIEVQQETLDATKSKRRPPSVPRPVTLYIFHNRRQFQKQHPEIKKKEIFKEMTVKFNSLSTAEQKPYVDEYQSKLVKHSEAFKQFNEVREKVKALSTKPLSARRLYIKKRSKHQLKKHPNSSMKELNCKYYDKWLEMSDDKKLVYINKALELERIYREEVAHEMEQHPDFVPLKFKTCLLPDEQKLKEKADGKTERPPRSGYHQFLTMSFEKNKVFHIKTSEQYTILSQLWNSMSEEERKPYIDMYLEKKKKYLESGKSSAKAGCDDQTSS